MTRVLLVAFIFALALGGGAEPVAEKQFKNPPPHFRPLIIRHSGPMRNDGAMDYLRQRRGGGYVMDAGGAETPSGGDVAGEETFISQSYLHVPENFRKLETMIRRLKSEGRLAWLYDEYAYPSGSAGGQVFADGHDAYAAWVVGCRVFREGESIIPGTDSSILSCVALPIQKGAVDLGKARDLTEKARKGDFSFDSPGGAWRICLFEKYHPDTWKRHNMGRRLLNVLDRDAVSRFIDVTHRKYADELGPVLKEVGAFFTDEPQFGSAEFWGKGGLENADPMIQWTDELLSAFEKKKGYGLVSVLPALFMDAGPGTAKYRYDFYDVQSDLMAENYFGQIQDWCHAHGTLSSGHMLLEESLLFHVMFSGSAFKNWAKQDLPGMDLLGAMPYRSMAFHWDPEALRTEEDVSCKMVSSVAHALGKPGVFSESFATAKKATLRDVLGSTAWQYSEGITHQFTYTIQNHFSADEYAAYSDFAGRLALFARRGVPVSSIAVVAPEASVWATYVPPSGGGFGRYFSDNPAAAEIDYGFRKICGQLLASQTQFECISDGFLQQAEVKGGLLCVGSMKFSMLILPNVHFLAPGVVEKLYAFSAGGGAIHFVDTSTEVSPAIKRLVGKYPENIRDSSSLSLDWIGRHQPDNVVGWEGDSNVRMLVKNDEGRAIVILGNPSREPVKGTLRVPTGKHLKRWDPETGECFESSGGTLEIAMDRQTACIVTISHIASKRPR